MRAFKWFRKVDGQLVSHNPSLPAQARVIYSTYSVNKPRVEGSQIFVFESLDAAYDYNNGRCEANEELWEVDIPDNSKPLKVRANVERYNFGTIAAFWLRKKAKKNTWGDTAPKGTLGADWVSLNRRVKF
jgi:hypothetical protein